ncbi:bifunctional (p)ppGpp synthetase/guanosine-3',5'-bis(diphosphate) 3'-pyrophosphohydrolase [Trichlorobacter lovleyi]|uniref:RelA/SpoT family protein n=1 Tax=Trichlorobacter lovleyi TaxID=313985 RepID=UPI002240BFCE|nr:bifunctional (p)ppGpp synthetase/guanosine-3',5'-bis(diphosphate) 3'-pyrophosphohydrolase [Trichlorobacter lovleyi]QOX79319.1 bifunctional (p)ppGpp synthetase/guanosine-3',5'-bis(diphosphate) 3'-pyrophosphohydrolase [Trichlorobacter lovleyi]
MIRLNDILDTVVTYNPSADLNLIRKAYVYCAKVHQGQTRLSGEPYIIHPLEVAGLLAGLKLDVPSIVTGFLHDTIEDTLTTSEELAEMFGKEVAELVDGVTKISKIHFKTKEENQAENFRKMLIAMANDIRVILVKLADRLHNMRTLQFQPDTKQRSISRETMDIYAPIAHRLGISWIKTELEDLSFRYLQPDVYFDLATKIQRKKQERESFIHEIQEAIRQKLVEHQIVGEVSGRSKHLYSIYRKMEKRKVDFEEIYDLTALRILVDDIKSCYEVLGLIHSSWRPIPGRFKDYIAMPKGNMYQSLHTTVIGPHGDRMEVQIRTHEMHRVAEAGIAAHWKYKEGKGYDEKEVKRFAWLRQLLEWQQELQDSREFMDSVKVELFPEEVYVFTPKGDVKGFPKGSTPIDFAYAVHTDVGHRCVGAKVNGKLVPLKHELQNGDIVEVITSPHHTPSKDWLKIVRSSRARNKIRAWIKIEERKRSIVLGRELCEKEFRKYSLNLQKVIKGGELRKIANEYGFNSEDDLLAAMGYGKVSAGQVIGKLIPEERLQVRQDQKESRITSVINKLKGRSSSAVEVGGMEDIMIRYAKCCNPLPGDEIVGFITRGQGVTIHTADCPFVAESDPERRIDVTWAKGKSAALPVRLRVFCMDEKGILANMTLAITNAEANIVSAQIKSTVDKRGENIFELNVTDLTHLNKVVNALMKVKGVMKVERVKS